MAYTVLYCSVIFGIFILQFTKGQAFSLNLGAMTVTGRQERTETGVSAPLLPLHIVSNGLELYISEQYPVYAVGEDDKSFVLHVLAYQPHEKENRFSVRCSGEVTISFFSEKRDDIDVLRVEAVLPESIKKILLPWKLTQNADIERANGKIFVRSGKKQYTFTEGFGFDTEEDDAFSETPHLALAKTQPVAYYKTYLPLQELNITAIPSMALASVEVYTAAIDTFASAAVNAGVQALSSKKITEKVLTVYLAEMGRRGKFADAIEKAPAQTLVKSARTYLSNPFYGNVLETHAALAADDIKKREWYSTLINTKNPEIFEYEGLIPFLADRGTQRNRDELFQLIETVDADTLNARQAAGLLAIWLDCVHYYPDKKMLFEELLPLCEKKITESLLLIDEGLYLSNDGTYIDSSDGLIAAQILMRYGDAYSAVWQSVARMLVTSLLRYSGESAGLPVGFTVTGSKATQLGLIADDRGMLDTGNLYPLVMSDNSWYPHVQSLALQAEAGIWAWTCAQSIEVLENTSKTLLLRIHFPEGRSHYLTLHGVRPFYRIELYGIPFRSDVRFEMYNSSGYSYNPNTRILYLKMRHKSEYETIRLSFGTAPQLNPAAVTEPAAAVQSSPETAAESAAPETSAVNASVQPVPTAPSDTAPSNPSGATAEPAQQEGQKTEE